MRAFFVPVPGQPAVRGFALGEYHPIWQKEKDANGRRVKNPHFDNFSQQIYNTKDSSKQVFFLRGVGFCTSELIAFLRARPEIPEAEFLIIPSSRRGQVSQGLTEIVKRVCRVDRRFSHRPGSMRRTRDIEKLATGGDRSLQVHLQSLEYRDAPEVPPYKIIFDDITTSANSIAGAIMVTQQVIGPRIECLPIALGQTTRD